MNCEQKIQFRQFVKFQVIRKDTKCSQNCVRTAYNGQNFYFWSHYYVPQTINPSLIKPNFAKVVKIGKTALDQLAEGTVIEIPEQLSEKLKTT